MADTLTDMAYTKAELKEEKKEYISGDQAPYPWGLCLSLQKAELDKLGIKDLPQVGSEWHFLAVATVTGVNQSASVTQDEETRVGLQITMMQVLKVESADEEKSEGADTPAKEAGETRSMASKYQA